MSGGVADEDFVRFGRVALYAGGTGEVRFKDVVAKGSAAASDAARRQCRRRFRMQALNEFYYSWSPIGRRHQQGRRSRHRRRPVLLPRPGLQRRARDLSWPRRSTRARSTSTACSTPTTSRGTAGRTSSTASSRSRLILYVNPKGESRRWDSFTVTDASAAKSPSSRISTATASSNIIFKDSNNQIVCGDARPGESDRDMGQATADRARSVDKSRHGHRRRQQGRPRGSAERLRLVGTAGQANVRAVDVSSCRVRQMDRARALAARRSPSTTSTVTV